MGVAIELGRVNAVLDHDEGDVADLQIGLLLQLAPQRIRTPLSEFDLPAGNPPKIRPFARAHHEDLAGLVEDQGPDRGHGAGGRAFSGGGRRPFELESLEFEQIAQFAEVLDDQIGLAGPQLGQAVVTGEHGARVHTAAPGGFDIMFHVADEHGLARSQAVVSQHKAFVYLYDWLGLKEVAVLEPKPGVEPSASHLQAVLSTLRATPARMVLYAAYQDSRPSVWLSKNAGIAAVKLPFTVGGTEAAKDLFGLFDDTVTRLLAAGGKP